MRKIALLSLALLFPLSAQAAIFDAPDILAPRSGAVGLFGELLLSDPTSEGIEARSRYGLSEEWNLGGILGTGSNGKRFRIGGEAVYSIIPDWEGQIGLSALATALYLKRPAGGGIQLRTGLMGHKRITGWTGHPVTLFVAVPFQIEARGGSYTTGSQLVLGSLWDTNSQGRFYFSGEAGIKLGKTESYVLFGAGFRLGELRFQRREGAPARRQDPAQPDFRDEDFL
jgi:hypothetical protein